LGHDNPNADKYQYADEDIDGARVFHQPVALIKKIGYQ
jgi:hypothetical protein